MDDESSRTRVRIRNKDSFGDVASAYAGMRQIKKDRIIFMLEGNEVKEEETASRAGLKAESLLYAHVKPE